MLQDTQFRGLLILVATVLIIGMLFYSNVEHWSLLNSLYFCVVTLTTVGYGDFSPHTSAGKIFTIFYILIGVGIILGFVNVIAKHATKKYLTQSDIYLGRSERFIEKIIEKTLQSEHSKNN